MTMPTQAQLLRQVRLALQNQDYAGAVDGLRQAAALARDSDDRSTEARHLGNLALLYYRLGEPDQALTCFDEALEAARADSDRMTENGLLGNMGNILRELERFREAAGYLNQALLIAQETGDLRGRGIWLGNLGLVNDDLKQYARAVELHHQSVEIARELNDKRGLATRLGNLGNSYISLNDFHSALQQFHEATALYRELGDWGALSTRLGVVGRLYADLGRQAIDLKQRESYLDLSLEHYQQALMFARYMNDRRSEAELLRNIGTIYAEVTNYEQAIAHLNEAMQRYAEANMPDLAQETRQQLETVQGRRKAD
jgi:tetratricopeptide (TPR) repeat protein